MTKKNWHEYETHKKELQNKGLSAEEYEQAVREMAKRYGY